MAFQSMVRWEDKGIRDSGSAFESWLYYLQPANATQLPNLSFLCELGHLATNDRKPLPYELGHLFWRYWDIKCEDKWEWPRRNKIYHIQIQIPYHECSHYVYLNCTNQLKFRLIFVLGKTCGDRNALSRGLRNGEGQMSLDQHSLFGRWTLCMYPCAFWWWQMWTLIIPNFCILEL